MERSTVSRARGQPLKIRSRLRDGGNGWKGTGLIIVKNGTIKYGPPSQQGGKQLVK